MTTGTQTTTTDDVISLGTDFQDSDYLSTTPVTSTDKLKQRPSLIRDSDYTPTASIKMPQFHGHVTFLHLLRAFVIFSIIGFIDLATAPHAMSSIGMSLPFTCMTSIHTKSIKTMTPFDCQQLMTVSTNPVMSYLVPSLQALYKRYSIESCLHLHDIPDLTTLLSVNPHSALSYHTTTLVPPHHDVAYNIYAFGINLSFINMSAFTFDDDNPSFANPALDIMSLQQATRTVSQLCPPLPPLLLYFLFASALHEGSILPIDPLASSNTILDNPQSTASIW
ncbi:MAG: hypothetical protein ACRCZI_11685, partial [Cetobacterium sp.]